MARQSRESRCLSRARGLRKCELAHSPATACPVHRRLAHSPAAACSPATPGRHLSRAPPPRSAKKREDKIMRRASAAHRSCRRLRVSVAVIERVRPEREDRTRRGRSCRLRAPWPSHHRAQPNRSRRSSPQLFARRCRCQTLRSPRSSSLWGRFHRRRTRRPTRPGRAIIAREM